MRTTAAVLALILSLLPSPAYADSGADQKEAQALFDEGKRLMDNGLYDQARLKFKSASVHGRSAELLWNLGYCEYQSKHYVEGVRHLRQYMLHPRAKEEKKRLAKDDYIPKALRQVADLEIQTTEGATVAIDGINVTLDDKSGALAPLPFPIPVAPGAHRIEARLGSDKAAKELNVRAGEAIQVPIPIGRSPEPPVPEQRVAAPTAPIAPPVQESGHPPSAVPAPPEKTTWPPPTISIVLAGVTAVGLGSSIYFALDSRSQDDERKAFLASHPGACASRTSPTCGELEDIRSAQSRSVTISSISLGVAGAAGIATILTWYAFRRDKSAPQTTVIPTVNATGAGVSIVRPF